MFNFSDPYGWCDRNFPVLKFWGIIITILMFGIIPWFIGLGTYMKILINWIF